MTNEQIELRESKGMYSRTTKEMIDEAIRRIESEWIEYTNGSKSMKEAQRRQRFILRELIESAQLRDKCSYIRIWERG